MTCPMCNGEGEIDYYTPDGEITHTEICEYCDGTGVVPSDGEDDE